MQGRSSPGVLLLRNTDDEADRGDYLEWIQRLPAQGTQFDFHYMGGLMVEAH